MVNSYYSMEELKKMGFKKLGTNIFISKKTSIYSPEKISIGNNVRIDDFVILSGEITIGNYVHISAFVALYGTYGIEIGNYCGCSPRCIVFSASDDFSGEYMIGPMLQEKYRNVTKGKVIMKDFSQLGANTIVMPNVIIETGAVTGSLTFVNKNLEEWTINGGVPCKKIKNRSKRVLELYNEMREVNGQ